MKYTAPDGTTIESQNTPVTYSCYCYGIGDGIYESLETVGAATEIGIKQLKIKRIVENNQMTIVLTESTNQELIDYQNSLKPQE